jgi:hypothetical protein
MAVVTRVHSMKRAIAATIIQSTLTRTGERSGTFVSRRLVLLSMLMFSFHYATPRNTVLCCGRVRTHLSLHIIVQCSTTGERVDLFHFISLCNVTNTSLQRKVRRRPHEQWQADVPQWRRFCRRFRRSRTMRWRRVLLTREGIYV